MFERLSEHIADVAARRARARSAELAAKLRAELPSGIQAEAGADGVRLTGRGLARRAALDPALRWLLAALR